MSSDLSFKDGFLRLVVKTLYDHPDWFSDVIMASQVAMLEKLNDESKLRARVSSGLLMAYRHLKWGKLNKNDLEFVREIVLEISEGTEFHKTVEQDGNGP